MRLTLEYLKEMLKKAGLRAKMYYRTDFGWIDIFGIGRTHVACDVSMYPNMERYERLKYRSIVVTSFNDFRGKAIFTTEENIHKALSKTLSGDFTPYHDWLEEYEDKDLRFYERVFDVMAERYGKTIAKKLIEALVFLYISGGALDSTEKRIPYSALYPYLTEMGFVVKETKEIVKPKNFTVFPTLDGVRLAKVEIYNRIDEHKIYRIVKDFGFDKMFIAILGLSDRRGMFLTESEHSTSSDFYDLIGTVDLNIIFKVSRNKKPIEGLCSTVCYTILYEDIVSLFKKLMEMGLAFYYPTYDVYGSFLGKVYGMPREVVSLLSSMSFCKIERDYVERFRELVDMFYKRSGVGSEFEKAFELGVIERCEGGIKLNEKFENFARVRFAKLLSEFCKSLE